MRFELQMWNTVMTGLASIAPDNSQVRTSSALIGVAKLYALDASKGLMLSFKHLAGMVSSSQGTALHLQVYFVP